MKMKYILISAFLVWILIILGLSLSSEIRVGFLANILADFMTGIIFGVFVAWWLNLKLKEFDKSQHRKDEKREDIEKAIRYLDLIQTDINRIVGQIPDNLFSYAIEARHVPANVDVRTPLWDTLQPSGELPKLLKPDLLSRIAICYNPLIEGWRWISILQEGILKGNLPPSSGDYIATLVTQRLQEAREQGQSLIDDLPGEILALKKELQELI